MLELLLLRHAKSRWDRAGEEDHERDLAPRGLEAAPRMGRLLQEQDLIPELALCSTATRARRSWALAAAAIGQEIRTRYMRELYLAPPDELLGVIRQQEGPRRLLLVGHNPGLHELAQLLARRGDPVQLHRLRQKLPTAALVRLDLEAGTWSEVAPGSGTLAGFWRPKDLDRADH